MVLRRPVMYRCFFSLSWLRAVQVFMPFWVVLFLIQHTYTLSCLHTKCCVFAVFLCNLHCVRHKKLLGSFNYFAANMYAVTCISRCAVKQDLGNLVQRYFHVWQPCIHRSCIVCMCLTIVTVLRQVFECIVTIVWFWVPAQYCFLHRIPVLSSYICN